MDLITKAEAVSQGLTYYFTGEPCKRGHISRRLTKSAYCYECWREVKTRWLGKTGKGKEYTAKYRASLDQEALRAKGREYKKEARRRNPEHHKAMTRRYYERNVDIRLIYNASKRRDVKERTPPWVDRKMRNEMMNFWREAKRLTRETGIVHEVDHKIPLLGENVSGLNVPWNLEILTRSANRSKHARTPPLPVVLDAAGKLVCPDFYAQKAAPKQWLQSLSDEHRETYVQYVFKEMRTHGFPMPERVTAQDLGKAVRQARKALNVDNDFMKSRHGLMVASSYFPHMYSIRSRGMGSPMDAFDNDGWLLDAIRTRTRIGNHMSPKGMLTMLSATSNSRSVTNFRPMVAATLAARYGGQFARILDPCAGWGGRLFGAAIAPNVLRYTGCEPATSTVVGLRELATDMGSWVEAEILPVPFEDAALVGEFDFAITSPPYFDFELYSDEDTQSFKRWPTKTAWRAGFLQPLMRKTFLLLRSGAVFALNIANTPSYRTLEADAVHEGLLAGFVLETTLDYLLAQRTRGTTGRSEPIFIFRKP